MHDEAQPEGQRARRGTARPRSPAPADAARARTGRARADVAAAALAGGDLRAAAREPPAVGGRSRRARGPAADSCLSRGSRRDAIQGADARHGARHEPGDGDDGGLRRREGRDRRARRYRRRGPAREGRRPGRMPDADEPEHARAVRRAHRGDRPDRPRHRRDPLLRRREPERGDGHLAARRHGLRHRPREPAQVVLPAARRRRPGRRANRGVRPDRAVPSASAGREERGVQRRGAALRPRLRPPEVDRAAARVPGQLRSVRALLRVHPEPRRRRPARGLGDRRPERQLPAGADAQGAGGQVSAGGVRPCLASTSSCSPARGRSAIWA